MAKLEYTKIKPRKIFKLNDEYWEVITSSFAKKKTEQKEPIKLELKTLRQEM